tara:strand:- start:233 stop:568 length:336 start_codon:yes stop_codon:yes gene_type:complete
MGVVEKIMKRFDIWLIMKDLNNSRVVENLGLCVIVSPDELKDLPTYIVAPLTTQGEELNFRIKYKFDDTDGFIMIDQIRAVDKSYFIKKMGELEGIEKINLCNSLQEFYAF